MANSNPLVFTVVLFDSRANSTGLLKLPEASDSSNIHSLSLLGVPAYTTLAKYWLKLLLAPAQTLSQAFLHGGSEHRLSLSAGLGARIVRLCAETWAAPKSRKAMNNWGTELSSFVVISRRSFWVTTVFFGFGIQ